MKQIQRYLPSAQFTLIVGSILLAGGLVYAAQRITTPPTADALASISPPNEATNWQATLDSIQGQNASTSLPQPLNPASIEQALKEAQTSNLTNTVGRTLLIDLTNAKSQGLGDDPQTQQSIVSDLTTQIKSGSSTTYTINDLTVVANSNTNLKIYGNLVMAVLLEHYQANSINVFSATAQALDTNNASALNTLPAIQKQYQAIVRGLLATPVPQTLVPLHLLVVNDFERMSESISDMENLLSDPVRGTVAMQQFNSALSEENRVFTNIAQELQKNDILFSKSEPGSLWSNFSAPIP